MIEGKHPYHCLTGCVQGKISCGDIAVLILKKWSDLLDKEYLEKIFKQCIDLYLGTFPLSGNAYKLAMAILEKEPGTISSFLIQETVRKYSQMCLNNFYGKFYRNDSSSTANQNPRALVFLILKKRGREISDEQIQELYQNFSWDLKLKEIISHYLRDSERQLTLKTLEMPKKQKICGCSIF